MKFDPNYNPYPSARNVHYAKKGMVATSQPLAAQAGLDMIKQGGNAVDAAIAAAACLAVTEPTSNGIGGDAFAIVWIKGQIYGLNSSGPAPEAISIDAVRDAGHKAMPRLGWLPVTVPGVPAAWSALSKRFGALTLAECLVPAIEYAREGFPVSPTVAKYWDMALKTFSEQEGEEFYPFFNTFAPQGHSPLPGEIVKLPWHANTLEEIGETLAESFYTGALADTIDAFSAKTGGFLRKSDLEQFHPTWVTPISIDYRGYNIWEMPPNSQGLVALMALNILKGCDFAVRDHVSTYHNQFEAIKLAFAAGKEFITDPAHMQTSVSLLFSDHYASKLRDRIGDEAAEPAPIAPKDGGTVYLAAADGHGNMVSYIQSNANGFGSGIVVPGTGIALQNRGAAFSLDTGHANALMGGKRSYHTIIPGFVTKDNRPIGPFGVIGGYMQPQGHVQVVMNSIDFGLNPQAALDAPRWQWMAGKMFHVEHAFPRHIAQELARRGHQMHVALDSGNLGRGQIIWRDPETGVLSGGTESRCDGAIAAW